MFRLSPVELTLLLTLVILFFGAGRIGKIASELGGGIRAFKKGFQKTTEEIEQ